MSFKIVTDSCANLTDEQIKNYDIEIVSLSYIEGDNIHKSYVKGVKTDTKKFYDFARKKIPLSTSLPTQEDFSNVFKKILEQGNDILYIGFSSALSGTYQMGKLCIDDLKEKYPERKLLSVDSLCASLGQGLLVHYAVQYKNEGKSIEDTYHLVEDNKLNICHWFTVDDLFFLKRGGRLSATSAIAGSILHIKPILHVSDEGKLVPVGKVIGRKKSLDTLVDKMEKSIDKSIVQPVYISHGDCTDDAEYVAQAVRDRFGFDAITINYVDPVIGVHSGPGTVALFFVGAKR
ncbi:MAG: DegV family protein [Clostridiales bacterium]|nr:DegV family protein [Clostridiales bacterium]